MKQKESNSGILKSKNLTKTIEKDKLYICPICQLNLARTDNIIDEQSIIDLRNHIIICANKVLKIKRLKHE